MKPDFLNKIDMIQFEKVIREKNKDKKRKLALKLIVKLCSASWVCAKNRGHTVSEYLKYSPAHHEIAIYLAKLTNIRIEEAASHDLYIISFFAHIGFVDKEDLLPKLKAGKVSINGDPIKIIDGNIKKLTDIEGHILFDCVLLNISGEYILTLPHEEYRFFPQKILLG